MIYLGLKKSRALYLLPCLQGEELRMTTFLQVYESGLNPFNEFQSIEREGRLPGHERALLAGSRYVSQLLKPIKAACTSRAMNAMALIYDDLGKVLSVLRTCL